MDWSFEGSGPIYGQIVEKLRLAVASGELKPGERLMAVRELALEAGVNPNTVQRALSELEREGLVYSQRTSGRFVTEDMEVIGRVRRELAEKSAADFLAAMGRLGYGKRELIGLLEDKMYKEDKKNGDT